jgi:hypothetical protein
VSSEPIVSPTAHAEAAAAPSHCVSCGAALAPDQRYCLQCGERCVPMSSVLAGGPAAAAAQAPGASPPRPPGTAQGQTLAQRNPTLTVIAGIGVLLLAMGVGVLIGRAGAGSQKAPPAQVISVGGGGAGTGSGATSEATFTSDWPSGKKGYTVQLQALPQASTSVSVVEADKSAASGKGATSVGALKSDEFASLSPGDYVIYSGVYSKRAEATKALAGLKKNFAGAKVIEVSSGGSAASSSSGGGAGATSKGAGSSITHPAPPSVLNGLHNSKGKSYEEKSKNLPDVVETG